MAGEKRGECLMFWVLVFNSPLFLGRYQSLPRTSPPFGVQAAAQVVGEMLPARNRTLPSPSPTRMPETRGELANRGSQVAFGPLVIGANWNIEAAPVI